MRKLSLFYSIFECKIKVCSFSKLIRISCVILSTTQTSCQALLGVSLSEGIILVKKSAFNNWSLNLSTLSVTIRGEKVMRCVQITIPYARAVKSKAIFGFSPYSVLVSQNRGGIAHQCATHLYILCFGLTFVYSISLSVKRINPSGKANIDMIFALIAC